MDRKEYNILYVDDEETNLRIFKTAFKREYNILVASSGQEAIEIMRNNSVHLLITDQKMPEMSGTQLLEQTVVEFPDIIRIILTGFSDIESIVRAVNKAGIYQYITKPWERSEMQQTIEKALQAYELRNEKANLIKKLKEANEQLEAKVHERTKQLEDALQRVNDSIRYARRIQRAILPPEETLSRIFQEYFVLYFPKSIVSGDFYWLAEKQEQGDDKIIFALADCTGHGVPGALMSMVGESLLNQVVHDKEIHRPAAIVQQVAEGIQKQLNQGETQNRDGMDIAVIMIDRNEQKLYFAGARQDLLYIKNGKMEHIKGDNTSAGGEAKSVNHEFVEHCIALEPGMSIYLFSDGFQDQFGGPEDRKFTSKKLRELIAENMRKPLEEQGEELEDVFRQWRGGIERQIDDVTVVGFKF